MSLRDLTIFVILSYSLVIVAISPGTTSDVYTSGLIPTIAYAEVASHSTSGTILIVAMISNQKKNWYLYGGSSITHEFTRISAVKQMIEKMRRTKNIGSAALSVNHRRMSSPNRANSVTAAINIVMDFPSIISRA